MSQNNPVNATTSPDMVIVRVFDAPRAKVWKAWTDPEQVMKWWGPVPFTCPAATIDLRVGGKYHFAMRSPEGQDFWTTGTYQEITPMDRLVFTDSFANEKGDVIDSSEYGFSGFPAEMTMVLTFEELENGKKTQLTVREIGLPAGEMGEMSEQGMSSSLDKLAEILK